MSWKIPFSKAKIYTQWDTVSKNNTPSGEFLLKVMEIVKPVHA